MTCTMSDVTDDTSRDDMSAQQPERPSRLAERRAVRTASPARAAVSELPASGALDGLFDTIDTGDLELAGDGGSSWS